MKSLLLGILCALFISAIISVNALDFDITSGPELSFGGRNSHKQDLFTRNVTIKNNFGADIRFENIQPVFTPQNNFRQSGVEINDTPSILSFSEQHQVSVNIRLEDFDAVDEDLELRGSVDIGTLKFTAMAINVTNSSSQEGSVETGTVLLKLEVKNDLEIISVELRTGDNSFSSIDANEAVTILMDEDYDLRFKIKNNFESNSNIEFEDISIKILSDDLNIDKSTSISEILPAQQGEKTTSLSVDDTGTGEVKILVEGNDRYGGKHGKIFLFEFTVEEAEEEEEPVDENDEDGDGVPDGEDACLGTVSVCDVDANGCPIDSDEDDTCDSLDPTPQPSSQSDDEKIDTSSGNKDEDLAEDTSKTKQTADDEDSTSGFIPFLIGFAVGIMVTAGFSVLIKN